MCWSVPCIPAWQWQWAKVAKDTGTPLIVPNAGAAGRDRFHVRAQHFPQLVLSNWQPGYAMGEVVAAKGHKNVVTITWHYAAATNRCAVSRKPSRRPEARWSRN